MKYVITIALALAMSACAGKSSNNASNTPNLVSGEHKSSECPSFSGTYAGTSSEGIYVTVDFSRDENGQLMMSPNNNQAVPVDGIVRSADGSKVRLLCSSGALFVVVDDGEEISTVRLADQNGDISVTDTAGSGTNLLKKLQ